VQHKRVGVSAEFGDDERYPLHHQSGNEGDITREAIELGHDHRAFCLAGKGEGGILLRPSIKSVRALSGFDLGELLEDDHSLGLGKAGDRGTWSRAPGLTWMTYLTLRCGRDPGCWIAVENMNSGMRFRLSKH
jgi:hypothetical protein